MGGGRRPCIIPWAHKLLSMVHHVRGARWHRLRGVHVCAFMHPCGGAALQPMWGGQRGHSTRSNISGSTLRRSSLIKPRL